MTLFQCDIWVEMWPMNEPSSPEYFVECPHRHAGRSNPFLISHLIDCGLVHSTPSTHSSPPSPLPFSVAPLFPRSREGEAFPSCLKCRSPPAAAQVIGVLHRVRPVSVGLGLGFSFVSNTGVLHRVVLVSAKRLGFRLACSAGTTVVGTTYAVKMLC